MSETLPSAIEGPLERLASALPRADRLTAGASLSLAVVGFRAVLRGSAWRASVLCSVAALGLALAAASYLAVDLERSPARLGAVATAGVLAVGLLGPVNRYSFASGHPLYNSPSILGWVDRLGPFPGQSALGSGVATWVLAVGAVGLAYVLATTESTRCRRTGALVAAVLSASVLARTIELWIDPAGQLAGMALVGVVGTAGTVLVLATPAVALGTATGSAAAGNTDGSGPFLEVTSALTVAGALVVGAYWATLLLAARVHGGVSVGDPDLLWAFVVVTFALLALGPPLARVSVRHAATRTEPIGQQKIRR